MRGTGCASPPRSDHAAVIPVSVLTGFPRQRQDDAARAICCASPNSRRTAVIINEFGEVGLDHDLVEASTESFIELQTGCLCCKVRSDLVQTLEDMLRRRDAGTVPPFTRVVIETSGLADPAPILHTLMTDAGLAGRLVLAAWSRRWMRSTARARSPRSRSRSSRWRLPTVSC